MGREKKCPEQGASLQQHLQMGLTEGMSIALQSFTSPSASPATKLSKGGKSAACFSLPYFRCPVKLRLSLTEAVGGRQARENMAGKMPRGSMAWHE